MSVVDAEGHDPSIPHGQQIFLLLYVSITSINCCSLEYVFTISYLIQTQVAGIYSLHIYNSNFDKHKKVSTTIIWMSAKQMEITIDLARRCLGLSPNQPASTLVVSNKALSFTVYQEESLSCIPIPTRIRISLSVYIIHQNSQKVKILVYLVAKHPIHKRPLRGDFECWFARTIHSLLVFPEVFS